MTERVLVAMSGGVDSAVAAALLHRQGYDVIGVTLRLYTEADDAALSSGRTCCGIEDIGDARLAAQRIGIPHYVLNMEREFERDVVDYFVGEYAQGRTPNPCLACNQHVKFSTLLNRALAMGVDRLATGHYAIVEPVSGEVTEDAETTNDTDGTRVPAQHYRLHRAVDDEKDQSYVLYTLDQDALRRTLFPLGGMTKHETRAVADEFGLPLADKPDSVDICFVPGGDYRQVLASRGVEMTPGPIETPEGDTVGSHGGVAQYTVGQRRGLGIGGPERRFVTSIDAQRNVIVVGGEDELARRRVIASEPHWVDQPPAVDEPLHARVRYHAADLSARVVALEDDSFAVEFDDPVRAVAPGQAIVLYRGTEVVGGGTIDRTEC